jgi:hypothetical protein
MGRYSRYYDPDGVRDLAYSILRDAGRKPHGKGLSVTDLCVLLDWMHEHIAYELDCSQYGKEEYIATPKETLKSGRGDCEDHALLFGSLCLALGAKVRFALVPGHAFSEICLGPSSNFNGNAAIADIRRYITKRSKGFDLPIGDVPFSQGKLASGWTRSRSGTYTRHPRRWSAYSRKFHRVQWNVSDGEVYMPIDDCYCMMYPGDVARMAEFKGSGSQGLWRKVDYEYPSSRSQASKPSPEPSKGTPSKRPKRVTRTTKKRPSAPKARHGKRYTGTLIALIAALLVGGHFAAHFPLAVDSSVACLLLWTAWQGYEVGLFEQGIKLAAWLIPVALSLWLLDRCDTLYLEYVAVEVPYRRALIALVLFASSALTLRALVNLVADGRHSSVLDGLLGAVFGAAMGLVGVSLCILLSLRFGADLGWTPPYGDSIAASYAQDYTPFETDEFNQAREAFDALEVTPRLP